MHPWIGAGEDDRRAILDELGVASIDELFATIPSDVCVARVPLGAPGDCHGQTALEKGQCWKQEESGSFHLSFLPVFALGVFPSRYWSMVSTSCISWSELWSDLFERYRESIPWMEEVMILARIGISSFRILRHPGSWRAARSSGASFGPPA